MKLTLLRYGQGLVIIPGVLLLLSMYYSLYCFLLHGEKIVVKSMNACFGYVVGFVEHLTKIINELGNGIVGGVFPISVCRDNDQSN